MPKVQERKNESFQASSFMERAKASPVVIFKQSNSWLCVFTLQFVLLRVSDYINIFSMSYCGWNTLVCADLHWFTMSYCEVFQSSSMCLSLTSFLLRTISDYLLYLPGVDHTFGSTRPPSPCSYASSQSSTTRQYKSTAINRSNNRFVDTSELSLVKGMIPTKDQSKRSLRKP